MLVTVSSFYVFYLFALGGVGKLHGNLLPELLGQELILLGIAGSLIIFIGAVALRVN